MLYVDRAKAQVVAGDQSAHAVRDDIDAQFGVAVVLADIVDQPFESLGLRHIVLAPVVWEKIIQPLPLSRSHSRRCPLVAAEPYQHVHDRAIEILAENRLGDVECLEVVRSCLQGRRIEVDREVAVVVEQNAIPRPRPDFDAGRTTTEFRAEQTGNQDHRSFVG